MSEDSNLSLKITDGKDRREYNFHRREAMFHNDVSRRLSADPIRSKHHRDMSLKHLDSASGILSKYDTSFKT